MLWNKVPDLMKKLWTRIHVNEMYGSGVSKKFKDLIQFRKKYKWNIVREIAYGCSKFLSSILDKRNVKKITDIKTITRDKPFMEQVRQINQTSTGYELEHSKHVVQLLYDCSRVGIDLNQVWSEIEHKANSFPLQMLSFLKGSPEMYIETWGRISSEQLLIPITKRMDQITQTIQQILEEQTLIKHQINNVEAKVDAIYNCIVVKDNPKI